MPANHVAAPTTALEAMASEFGATIQDVSIMAADGAVLRGWYLSPSQGRGESVVVLHGIGVNRVDSTGFSSMFLRRGYSVLLPDSRAHGESGGKMLTYGIVERNDVAQWVAWLKERYPGCTYLLGESMGAAIGLQVTAVAPQLCAVAVEDLYATFRAISYERLDRGTGTGAGFWKIMGRPILEVAIAYTRVRYGVYLPDAEPKVAVEASHVPSLLITGTADNDIPMHHAQELEAVRANHCALWIVSEADHGGASVVAESEFDQRVLDWFASHGRP